MELGLGGPAPPWGGGIAAFTSALAGALGDVRLVRWISWRPPRHLPPGTHLDPHASPCERAEPTLELYDRASWARAGRRLGPCTAIVLTLSHPALFVPYRSLVAAYRKLGGRVVLLCHNVVAHERHPGLRTLARRVLRLADALVVHSAAEADLARDLAPGVPVFQGFHPVYTDHVEQSWPERPGHGRLLAFGYVRPYKGVADLVAAMPQVPGATLEVVGRFHEPVARYARLVSRHGVGDRVSLADGYVPEHEVREVFARADVVVAPYRQASQSGVVHLALSLGRPVVATAVGGLTEAVSHGETGLLAPPGDAGALAGAIREALAAPPASFDAGIRRVVAARGWEDYSRLVLRAAAGEESP